MLDKERMNRNLLIDDVVVFDGEHHVPDERRCVVVTDGRISDVRPTGAPGETSRPDVEIIQGEGMTLMPGLIDAHFHCNSPFLDVSSADALAPSHLAHYAGRHLEDVLRRGFTTVRDAGGADRGLVRAIEDGLIDAPRLLISGKALSQTGGHGDLRRGVSICGCEGYRGSISCVVDGPEGIRRAVREELRQGAQQIKIFTSGGMLSPTDPVWMDQFTDDEIRAAVEEAARWRTYVMAHSLTANSARRCAQLGVRSIEHGFGIDAPTARLVADSGCYVTATLCIVHSLLDEDIQVPEASREKLRRFGDDVFEAVRHCHDAGIKVGLGTDLLGRLHGREAQELVLREKVSGALETLRSATSVNAELLNMKGEIGTVRRGAIADLLLVKGDPVRDISLLTRPDETMLLVIKDGRIVRDRRKTCQ